MASHVQPFELKLHGNMARQGGHKQRRLGQKPDVKLPKNHVESPLALLLLRKWSIGELSAPALQEIAKAAADSGCQGEDVQRLAMLGAAGHSPQNIQRDLMTLHFKDLKVPETCMVATKIWAKDADGQRVLKSCKVPILLPHEWMGMAAETES